ncbi:MAG: Ig-like domain-containing protein [Oleiphilus sp.]
MSFKHNLHARTVICFCTMVFTFLLSACGNSDDAEKVKNAIEVNKLDITSLQLISESSIIETTGTEQFTAQAIIGDGSTDPLDVSSKVQWSVSDSDLATINNSGKLTGKADGLVEVKARLADLSATKELMLSSAALEEIFISNNDSPFSVCSENNALIAEGQYEDEAELRTITTKVTWTPDDSSAMTINSQGIFSALKEGSTTVTASQGDINKSADITIEDDIESVSISAEEDSVYVGSTLTFTATGTYDDSSTRDITNTVTWSSSNNAFLSISNEAETRGTATGVAEGVANISAACLTTVNEVSPDLAITVEPQPVINGITIEDSDNLLTFKLIDSPEQLTANLTFSDGALGEDVTDSEDIIWSIDETVEGQAVEVDNEGEISFSAIGITRLKVFYRDTDDDIGPFEDTILIEIIAN